MLAAIQVQLRTPRHGDGKTAAQAVVQIALPRIPVIPGESRGGECPPCKSVRNAAAPSSGSGLEVSQGAVTAESALNWLTARGGFKNSIWARAADEESEPATETIQELEGEILWVPFASDKT